MSLPQILINNLCFDLPDGKVIFNNLSIAFLSRKIGLIGKNGSGKSTLIKLIVGELSANMGLIQTDGTLHYVAQNLYQNNDQSILEFLECKDKILALKRIQSGDFTDTDLSILNNEWDIVERVQTMLAHFNLAYLMPTRMVKSLSGGEITRLHLAKAFLSKADFLILDEPTNHLDQNARKQLYAAIDSWPKGLIVVSHDRTLLDSMEEMVELTSLGVNSYGGNYSDYETQRNLELNAHVLELQDAKKQLARTKYSIQSTREKHAQKQAKGRELHRSGSIDKLSANAKKGKSERSQNKMLIKEERMLKQAENQLQSAQEKIEISEEININLAKTQVPAGKIILAIQNLTFAYPLKENIVFNFNLTLQGAARVALTGDNGSGKTTIIKLILGQLHATQGSIYLGTQRIKYLDQDARLLEPDASVLTNFQRLNPESNENEAYHALAQFLFRNKTALKLVKFLSGGEKLRALLACVLMSNNPPQLLILDEPTNHLDINSLKSIESALNNYEGAMIVISHDQTFLKNLTITAAITAPFYG